MGRYTGLHIGCGDVKVEGFLNVDVRHTPATEAVLDCGQLSALASASFEIVYSNAFFEHVYVNQRIQCLRAVREVLNPGGAAVFTGLPNFEEIARAYIEKGPGVTKAVFDLSEAYRYTHGFPEGVQGWWLEQLHKGLFDAPTIAELLTSAEFTTFTVFGYCWGQERVPVNMGFLAFKEPVSVSVDVAGLAAFLSELPSNVNVPTLKILA